MLLEYLAEGSDDCPLLRLFEFSPAELVRLHKAVADLAAGRCDHVPIHKLDGVKSIGGVQLTFTSINRDRGIVQPDSNVFICGFTEATWDNVSGLIEPFMTGSQGFQWLSNTTGAAALLLSASGKW